MKAKTLPKKPVSDYGKKIWILNGLLLFTYILIQTPAHLWLMSISQGAQAKPFNGAMMPLAFVPDWRKSDYINVRGSLDYSAVKQTDLVPLPRIEDIKNDFNSNFTYLTMFRGKYMDEDRVPGAGSHDGVDIRAPIGTPVFTIANGKIVKVVDDPNNKYITVEHRDVKYGGKVGKFYSSYLHLSAITVRAGDVVDKGTIIGRVGMTGMTTTPHLHIQVDNDEAPFYPYWPFSYSEAADAKLDMYGAVDAGLNQDLILKYSVDPIDFIKKATTIDGPSVAANRTTMTPTPTPVVKNIVIEKPVVTAPKPVAPTPVVQVGQSAPGTYRDVSMSNPFYNSITYFSQKGILKGYDNGNFSPEKSVTRAELLSIVMRTLKIDQKGEIITGVFSDVPKNHWVTPFLSEAIKNKIISTAKEKFRPDAPITRVEFLAILVASTGEKLPTGVTKTWKDIQWSHWSYRYGVFAYQNNLFGDIGGTTFKPNSPLTRGEAAEALYRYLKTKSKL